MRTYIRKDGEIYAHIHISPRQPIREAPARARRRGAAFGRMGRGLLRLRRMQVDEFLPLVDSGTHALYRALAAWEGAFREDGKDEL